MNPAVPERERRLGAELGRGAELATGPGDAQQRLPRVNDRLWTGLHGDGIATIYGERPAAVKIAAAHNRSENLDAHDPLSDAERAHWTAHRALIDYQEAAERRRQLASEVGGLAGALIATLAYAGGQGGSGS